MRAEHADRSGVRYSLGDVLRHTKFGFRGVVVSWDRSARTDVRGWDGLVGSQLKDPNQQTFYDVLVATDDAAHFMGREVDMRYVAEENLEVVDSIAERRISNPITDQYMSGFNDQRGRFDPVTTLQYVFPDTEAYGSTPGATTTTTSTTALASSSTTSASSSSSSSDVARAAFTRVARDVASVASAARDAARELGGADGHWQRELVDDLCRPLLDGSLHHDESMVGDTAVEWSEAEQGELFAAMGGVQDTVRDFYFSIYCMTEYLSNIMIFCIMIIIIITQVSTMEALCDARSERQQREGIRFSLGQLVQHEQFGFRGVVCGWDRRPQTDVSQWDGVAGLKSGAQQPFFLVLASQRDLLARIAAQQAERESSGSGGEGPDAWFGAQQLDNWQSAMRYCAQENLTALVPKEISKKVSLNSNHQSSNVTSNDEALLSLASGKGSEIESESDDGVTTELELMEQQMAVASLELSEDGLAHFFPSSEVRDMRLTPPCGFLRYQYASELLTDANSSSDNDDAVRAIYTAIVGAVDALPSTTGGGRDVLLDSLFATLRSTRSKRDADIVEKVNCSRIHFYFLDIV